MKRLSTYILGIFILIISSFFIYKFTDNQGHIANAHTEYLRRIKQKRKEIETFMETSENSPFQNKQDFTGLKYFPIDTAYKILAKVEFLENEERVILSTSDNKQEQYIPWGRLSFKIKNQRHNLTIFKQIGFNDNEPFLPFSDHTNGKTTYGLGRYLPLDRLPKKGYKNTMYIDFNLAYSPFCAYNSAYTCPIPPHDNELNVAIEAGEKFTFQQKIK